MLNRLLNFSRKEYTLPPGKRIYAIGDIHGRLDLLNILMEKIDNDCQHINSEPQLVFLGDYIDRGHHVKGVIDRLIELKNERPNTIILKGNHEASFFRFLEAPEDHHTWIDWGGDETLKSYGVDDVNIRTPRDLADRLGKLIPQAHYEFLSELTINYSCGDFMFVHAGIRPGVELKEQSEHDQLWIRHDFHHAPRHLRPEKVIVHGHASAKKVVDKGWRICVDTGAVWTGNLTALVLEGSSKRFISTT